jgi:GTP-binding protein
MRGDARHAKPDYCIETAQRDERATRSEVAVKHPLQQARFLCTTARRDQLPPPGPPEVAFAGRSNAGKSSAINALANQTRLAFASRTPGRTQQINFFSLPNGALLADLPGYGYAAVPRDLKAHWQAFVAEYLATRQSLVGLALIVDARHGLADLDRDVLWQFLPSGRPVLLLATKMDKLGAQAQREARKAIEDALARTFGPQASLVRVVPFSATRRIGVEDAERILGDWLGAADDSGGPKEKASLSRGVTRGPKRPA